MKQKPKEKGISVAWFKLAELISRGEKEKALNLYRLLSHSFEEKAYALQVEGDILWSFEDQEAVDRYKHAAFLYKKEKNLVAAAGVYEHLLTLDPGNVDNMFHLLKLYAQLNWSGKFKEGFMFLKKMLDSKNVSFDRVREGAENIMEILEEKGRAVGSEIHEEIKAFL